MDKPEIGPGIIDVHDDPDMTDILLVASRPENDEIASLEIRERTLHFPSFPGLTFGRMGKTVAELPENKTGKTGAVEGFRTAGSIPVRGAEILACLVDNPVGKNRGRKGCIDNGSGCWGHPGKSRRRAESQESPKNCMNHGPFRCKKSAKMIIFACQTRMNMHKPSMLPLAAGAVLPILGGCVSQKQEKPNILLIVADDLGIGDVSCYGMGKIPTPNIDSLAARGVRFTNAYATSATSTPSRYALFTGMYPWTNPDARILPGDAPLLIPTDIPTLPKSLQEAGYRTVAIGKWHLGMGSGHIDWNQPISPCANDIGFDYSCLIAATNDRVPTVYVENGRVLGLDPDDPIEVSYEENFEGEPTALTNPELLRLPWHHGHNNSIINGVPRIGFMKGGTKARWVDEEMADYFCGLVKREIDKQTPDKPFFIYYGLHEPHVPRLPNQRFAGATPYGTRGDAIVEADWCVGEVIRHLDRKGLLDNTIVLFTSDNGPVLQDGYMDLADSLIADHTPAGIYRGGKYSLFDGGTHIPLLVYWKGHTRAQVSDALVSQLDFFASLTGIIGADTPEGLDSQDLGKTLLGKGRKGRDRLILEAKSRLVLKEGDYVLIPPYKGAKVRKTTGTELGNFDSWNLFNLKDDPHEDRDLAAKEPERLEKMKRTFLDLVGDNYDYDITAIRGQK